MHVLRARTTSISLSLFLSPSRHRDQSINQSFIQPQNFRVESKRKFIENIKVLALFSARVPADTS